MKTLKSFFAVVAVFGLLFTSCGQSDELPQPDNSLKTIKNPKSDNNGNLGGSNGGSHGD